MDDEKDIFQERKESLGYGMGKNPIQKAYGVTGSEHKLVKLAEKSFLSLWSYPNLFIDKGSSGTKGQEFCDLLIVFENHVLIFSDKDIDYPQIPDHELAWKRWFKRAVMKSADQIYGAERWLKQFPDRIFLDKTCEVRFPLDFPVLEKMILHRIVVAHGASKWCKQVLGGTGSLMIDPKIIGEDHYNLTPVQPFVIGQVNPEKGFVHIFDDTTLEVILRNFDTIADFTSYLTKKEKFIATGKLLFAAGEDEILAYYLKHLNDQQEHDFVFDEDFDIVSIDEGIWSDLQNNFQWKLKNKPIKSVIFGMN